MNTLISVIVPIYNVQQYLPECIDSILAQTYKNLEIILVDDGSPDSCPQICDDYAKRDDRIKVIHKPNGGLSDARNHGIRSATGEYLLFIDSDDFYDDRDGIWQLVNILIKYPDTDIVFFAERPICLINVSTLVRLMLIVSMARIGYLYSATCPRRAISFHRLVRNSLNAQF